jgi:hypothetical protein
MWRPSCALMCCTAYACELALNCCEHCPASQPLTTGVGTHCFGHYQSVHKTCAGRALSYHRTSSALQAAVASVPAVFAGSGSAAAAAAAVPGCVASGRYHSAQSLPVSAPLLLLFLLLLLPLCRLWLLFLLLLLL